MGAGGWGAEIPNDFRRLLTASCIDSSRRPPFDPRASDLHNPPAVRALTPLLLCLGLLACEEPPPPEAGPFVPPPIEPADEPPPRPVCDAELLPDPGPALVRRLSRVEYDNTVRDLLGDDLGLAQGFAAEEETLGFDNNARALQVSALHAEQFMAAAETLAIRAAERAEELLPCDPTEVGEWLCAASFIDTFGRRAWRRPLSPAELTRLTGVYEAAVEVEGADFYDGMALVIEALLQSPHFLYRIEVGTPVPGRPGVNALDSYELASRLSYLIWRSMPDDALLDAASRDVLRDPAGLAAEADRLFADPRAREGMWSFFAQWLRVDEVPMLERDPRDFPFYDEEMAHLLQEEARRFVEEVVFNPQLDMRDFFRAPFTFVNERLAGLYGLSGVTGPDFVKVALNPEQRAGVLTLGALMAVTAKARITSPILRGVFVREQLLCSALPPPPPNVPVIAPDPDPNLTTRERFVEHTESAACQGCHQLIDPIGFGFEHYDALGRWRETDGRHPVDASGDVVGTWDLNGVFHGAPELADRLAESEQAQRCVTTQVFRYAFGRGENAVDGCTLVQLYDAYRASGYDFQTLFRAVVGTDAFRFRRAQPDEVPESIEVSEVAP